MFNTLSSCSRVLTNTDVSEEQAENLLCDDSMAESDIKVLRADIVQLKTDMRAQMAEMEFSLITWQIGSTGLVVAAICFL